MELMKSTGSLLYSVVWFEWSGLTRSCEPEEFY